MANRKISVQSAKAKGRRLQQWVANKISELTGIKAGKDCDIESREMGQPGTDIKLYGEAKKLFPFSVECKYVERWDIPGWVKQAKDNQIENTDWLLVVKKNQHEEIIIMNANSFFKLLNKNK